MIEYYKQLYEILKSSSRFLPDAFDIKGNKVVQIANKLNIAYDCGPKFTEIQYKQKNHILAPTKENFLTLFNPAKEENLSKIIFILDFNNKPLLFKDEITYIDFILDENITFIHTIFAISKLLQFLIESEKDGFADFVSGFKIGFISHNAGKVLIDYVFSCRDIDVENIDKNYINYKNYIDTFIGYARDKKFAPFLKNAITAVCKPGKLSYNDFIMRLKDIIKEAEINHAIYLHSLSIDIIRKEYEEYRSKYFTELITIQSGLTKHIIAIPISIAAYLLTLFQNNITCNTSMMFLLLAIIYIVSFFLCSLLRLYKLDLKHIKDICYNDFDTLKQNTFFLYYPDQLKQLEDVYNLIVYKQRIIAIILYCIFLFIILTHIMLIYLFLTNILKIGMVWMVILLGIFLMATGLIYFFPKRKENIIEKQKVERND